MIPTEILSIGRVVRAGFASGGSSIKGLEMSGKAFLLELLAGVVSLCLWLLGWPVLQTVSTALNVLGAVLTVVGIGFGLFLVGAIIRSQLQPPYGG